MAIDSRGLNRLCAPLACGVLLLVVPAPALATPFGDLAQLPGTAGCVSEDGFDVPGANGISGACFDSRGTDPAGLGAANDVAISSDGDHLYVAARTSFVTAYNRDNVTGQVTGLAGAGGCKSLAVVTGCEQTAALGAPTGVAVSPDGENVYVSTRDSRSVVGFARDAGTGALTPVAGTGGCVKELAPFPPCADGRGLSSGADVVVTPDGQNVYVAAGLIGGSDAIAVFDRDDSTGEIVQKAGTAGCISESGADHQSPAPAPAPIPNACANAVRPLNDPVKLVVSPDGGHLYVGLNANNGAAPDPGVLVFDIAADGSLTESSCITQTGTSPCAQGRGMGVVQGLAISPDGNTVYAGSNAGSGVVAVLDRNPVTGVLTQDSGTDGCLAGSRDARLGATCERSAWPSAPMVRTSTSGRQPTGWRCWTAILTATSRSCRQR